MSKELVVSSTRHETRVAMIEDDQRLKDLEALVDSLAAELRRLRQTIERLQQAEQIKDRIISTLEGAITSTIAMFERTERTEP